MHETQFVACEVFGDVILLKSCNHVINYNTELKKGKYCRRQQEWENENSKLHLNVLLQVKELNHVLEAEKSCRTDLEMYVAVLNTQKSVLQEDAEKLRKELHDGIQVSNICVYVSAPELVWSIQKQQHPYPKLCSFT